MYLGMIWYTIRIVIEIQWSFNNNNNNYNNIQFIYMAIFYKKNDMIKDR